MGLFIRKPKKNRLYTLQEAISFINKNQEYSAIQEEGGYKVIPDSVANEHIDRYRKQIRQRSEFTYKLQAGYNPTRRKQNENLNYLHRYGYHEEER